jgi:hypothetical protein
MKQGLFPSPLASALFAVVLMHGCATIMHPLGGVSR